MCGGSEAVERKSERMDTAYSPRVPRVGEYRMWDGCVGIVLGFDTKDGWLVVEWRLIPSISGLENG